MRNAVSLLIKTNAAANGSAPIFAESNGGTNTRKSRWHIRYVAPAAAMKFRCAGKMNANTVLIDAISPLAIRPVVTMTDMAKIQAYQSAMSQARIMLNKGIIDKADIILIENKLAAKYGLRIGSIYREIDLIKVTD